jgi:type IV pilus assembly protein PilB
MSFLDELAKQGIISRTQIGDIKSRARTDPGGVDAALQEAGLPLDKIMELKGAYLNLPVRKVNIEEMSFEALKYISADSAEHYKIAPLELKDGVLEVGVIDPENIQAMDALEFISTKLGIPFKVFLISQSDYQSILEAYKGMESQVEEALQELGAEELDEVKKTSAENLSQELKNIKAGAEGKIVEDAQWRTRRL